MQIKREQLGLTYQEISDISGVPLPTVQKIIMGVSENPRSYNKQAIEMVLSSSSVNVHEGMPAVKYFAKKDGDYTLSDYYQLPGDRHCELIDGTLYDLASPTDLHQDLSFDIAFQLKDYINKKQGSCLVRMAPSDVIIDDSKKNLFQPDIYVMCGSNKNLGEKDIRVPDMVVEITSPETRNRDYLIKLNRYMLSGVKECWIVDTKESKVKVYTMPDGELVEKEYSFANEIPVEIYGGECKVKLSKLVGGETK